MAYLFAVEDCSDYAVATAAKEFIKGTIAAHDKRFAPSTATFADRARLHESNAKQAVSIVAKRPDLLQQVEASEEYRAEIRRRVAALPSLKKMIGSDAA